MQLQFDLVHRFLVFTNFLSAALVGAVANDTVKPSDNTVAMAMAMQFFLFIVVSLICVGRNF